MRRVVQVYKPPGRWVDEPPGWGDFLRGACALHERLHGTDAVLRVDFSATEFADLLLPDGEVFSRGDPQRIAMAPEFFEAADHERLAPLLDEFLRRGDGDFLLSTNLGAWDRLSLPAGTREFARRLYRFRDDVEQEAARALPQGGHEVLSIRCGDAYFDAPEAPVAPSLRRVVVRLLERRVLPEARQPVVLLCDSDALRRELAARYGLATLPHPARHGAFGGARAVALDLCALKGARVIHHFNAWADWWSGFSHYTALVFGIPSVNYRAPDFDREEVTPAGELRAARPWWRGLGRGLRRAVRRAVRPRATG